VKEKVDLDIKNPDIEHKKEWINQWKQWVQIHRQDFQHLTNQEIEWAEAFLQERIRIKVVSGVDIVFVDWDREKYVQQTESSGIRTGNSLSHREIVTHPGLELLMAYPKIHQVMIEYFSQELKTNIRSNPLVSLAARDYLVNYDPKHRLRERIFGFNSIIGVCEQYRKDILVGDIASHPVYMARAEWPYEFYKFITACAKVSITLNTISFVFFNDSAAFLRPDPAYIGLMSLAVLGILENFFRNKAVALNLSEIEKYWLDMEDSRRIFLANAIEIAAKRLIEVSALNFFSQTDSSTEYPAIAVIYPPHHNNRVVEKYLDHPPIIKQLIARILNFYLDYTLRIYSSTLEAGSKKTPGNSKHSWFLVERLKVPLRLSKTN